MLAPAAAALLSLLGGCTEGEKLTYVSTPTVPQTVTLVNTTTGEQIWSYDIPPDQALTVHFINRPSTATELGYDEMTWAVGPAGNQPPAPVNRMKVPPPTSRRIDVTVRPGPELPTGERAQRPVAAPAATPDGK
jgi:hypothetical protein